MPSYKKWLFRLMVPALFFLIGLVLSSPLPLSSKTKIGFQRVGLWKSFGDFKLLAPNGIAASPDGGVFIADRDSQRAYKVNADGKLIATCGGSGQEPGRFRRPFGIASDERNRVYVTDSDNNRIQEFDSRLRFLRIIDPGLPRPEGIAADGHDGLWVSSGEYSATSYPIAHLDPKGKITGCIGPALNGLLSRDQKGRLWAVNDGSLRKPILSFNQSGNQLKMIGDSINRTENAVAREGLIFCGDRGECVFRVFDEKGRQVGAAARDDLWIPDKRGGHAEAPYGLAFDNDGYLWATFLDSGAVARYRITRK